VLGQTSASTEEEERLKKEKEEEEEMDFFNVIQRAEGTDQTQFDQLMDEEKEAERKQQEQREEEMKGKVAKLGGIVPIGMRWVLAYVSLLVVFFLCICFRFIILICLCLCRSYCSIYHGDPHHHYLLERVLCVHCNNTEWIGGKHFCVDSVAIQNHNGVQNSVVGYDSRIQAELYATVEGEHYDGI
jgi:hypothetical protein